MQLASPGLRIHQDSIKLRVAYAKAGTAAGRCDWVRQHCLFIRKNATSKKFRQLARDLIYSCFGGWKHHLKGLRAKLGAKNRTHAVCRAIGLGLS